ncbi:polyadenylate-binding protein-interacting protein 1-like isoform X2 [Chironomus tepperi]|uniref:polyadenylate-binding protein-interacting protein 1-like isoform X2 n=1 Tax=Chironomus tepperi TaxID=113505 RepID=UPI00391F8081
MDPRYSQANNPDAYNAYIYGDWNHQAHHQEPSQNVFPPAPHAAPHAYPQNLRPFNQQQQPQQQQPYAQQQRSHFPVYQQQQQQSNRNYRPDLLHNHQSNYSNHQQQQHQQQHQPQHYLMMNQQPHQPMNNFQRHNAGGGGASGSNGGGGDNGMMQQGQQGSSIQNRLNFNAQQQQQPPVEQVVHEPVPHRQTETEQLALDYLGEVIMKLNDNPGLFETYQKKLRDMFIDLASNHFVMSNAIETIFEQSINEQNFRYTGARLCLLLDNLDLSQNSTFRGLLVMKMDFQNQEHIQFMNNEQRKVRGGTLFLAELFVQLTRPEDTRRAVDVSHYVLDSIMLLLTRAGPENVKCVCQTLKLAGYDLQKENPTEVEDAINQLRQISEEQNIATKRLIQSVVDLFFDNWGRKDEPENQQPAAVSDLQQNPPQYNDSPVFYGPDGKIITEEESSFLNSNMPENYPINIDEIIDDDSDYADDEPEMDLEMQMAYKEFIKEGGRKKD